MVSLIDHSEVYNQAKCLVRKFHDPLDKSTDNDKLEFCVDKNQTVRQLFDVVAKYYNLDLDSFYLTFSSFKTDSKLETNDKVFITIL